MKLLHTSDWHVGKAIRGASRADEHSAVLAEIAQIAEDEAVDLVIVAGDLFDSAAPSAEAEEIVYRALMALTRHGTPVAVIAGNHDNAKRLRAVAPLLELGRVHLVSEPTRPEDGGVRPFRARDGTPIVLAMLPFVSKRGIVRAEHLMERAAFEHAQTYAARVELLLERLCGAFVADAVNILVAHTFVSGGLVGGGERAAHLVDEYLVSAQAFPATIGYGALGHLHRPQRVPAGPPLHYCGSPLQFDFGEVDQTKQVNVVTVEPGAPADVRAVPLRAGRPLRTLTGALDQVLDARIEGEPWLRVIVQGPGRAGLAQLVRDSLGPGVVDVRIEPTGHQATEPRRLHGTRSPQELFAEYLRSEAIDDERVVALFGDLLDEQLEGSLR